MDRRHFVATALSAGRVLGANDRVRMGILGCGGRGQLLAAEFKEVGAEVAAVCDVYEPRIEQARKIAATGVRGTGEYRDVLDDASIDAVVVATPDHWHARMMVDAAAAGKDVYLEKPIALTVEDGFRMVDATRKHRRIVQVGTQRRSNELFLEAARIVQSGAAGDIRLVNSWWYNTQGPVRRTALAGRLDWVRWLGPAPKREFDPARFWGWLYFWDYASGLMAGQGAHIIDAIQMLMNSKWPLAVTCTAGKPSVEGAEFPETTCLSVEFPENYLAVFTCGYKAMKYAWPSDQMKQFNGSLARFDVGRENFALYPQTSSVELKASVEKRLPGSFNASTRSHVRNFLECVKSRQEPSAPIELGNYTSIVLCLGRESLKTGRRLQWDHAQRRAV